MKEFKRLVILDAVGEYPILQTPKVEVDTLFSDYILEEALNESGWPKPLIEETARAIFFGIRKNFEKNSTVEISDSVKDASGPYDGNLVLVKPTWAISEEEIKDYLNHFAEVIKGYWKHRGADDDYFDYLPSITDIYRQMAECWGFRNFYEKLVKDIADIEGWDLENPDNNEIEISLYTF